MTDYKMPDLSKRLERTATHMIAQARDELTKGRVERAYELENHAMLMLAAVIEINSLHKALNDTSHAVYVPFTGGTSQGGGRVPKSEKRP